MATRQLEPIHPGEILEEEFMGPLGLSANSLARRIDVPVTRISEIVRGGRGITADTALRLARLLGTSAELWLNLQTDYDLRVARRDLAGSLEKRIIPFRRPTVGYDATESTETPASDQVREKASVYRAPRVAPRTRDRRRIRRRTGR
jgi:addiction module HigA family antidote